MGAMRLTLMGVVGLALLLLATVAVVAEDGADPMAPAYFTFTLEPVEESSNSDMPEVMRGHRGADTIEATDARVSGLLTSITNWNWAVGDESGVLSAATSERLTNDAGAWVGEGRYMLAGAGGTSHMTGMSVLTGEGDYAGLTLILSRGWDAGGDPVDWGIIVPSDKHPPMPDPVEPTVE